MIQYGTEVLSDELKVVNPHHRQLTHQLKKTKEKLQRNNAQIFNYNEKYKEIDPKTQKKQDILLGKNEELKKKIEEIKKEKENTPYKIKLADMDPDKKFNKLKTESKNFMNILKMIAYRAESAMFNCLNEFLKNNQNEGRMLIKQLINSQANIKVDQKNKILNIKINSMSTPRYNKAVAQLLEMLNDTQTIYPGTDLMLKYQIL